MRDPSRLEQEYRRRLEPRESSGELRAVEAQVNKLSQGINRLIDTYAEGVIERAELEPRLSRLRERIEHLEDQAQQLQEQAAAEAEIRLLIGRIEEFAESVRENLKEVEWSKQREIIRTVVKRVEIFKESVKVVFRVGVSPPGNEGGLKSLQHCKRSKITALWHP